MLQFYRLTRFFLAAALFLLFGYRGVCAETYVSENITTSAVWTPVGSPYVLTRNVTIGSGVTLSVNTGTIILAYGYSLTVEGVLNADGVVFTSVRDEVYGIDAATPSPGDWGGIRFEANGGGTIENSTIKYASIAITSHAEPYSLDLDDDGHYDTCFDSDVSPTIRDNVITDVSSTGISVSAASSGIWCDRPTARCTASPTITGNTISRCGSDGIKISANGISHTAYASTSDVIAEASPIIKENTISEWGKSGISIYAASDGLSTAKSSVVDNIFSHSGSRSNVALNFYGNGWAPSYSSNTYNSGDHLCIGLRSSLNENRTWRMVPGVPFILTSDLVIETGATVSIPSGTVVLGSGGYSLTVEGVLNADGVVFTSVRDEVYGIDAATPSPGDWGGILFSNGGSGWVRNSTIRLARNGVRCYATGTYTVSPEISGNTIESCVYGVYAYADGTDSINKATASPIISNCWIISCSTGIYIQEANDGYSIASPTVSLISFMNNTMAIDNKTGRLISAQSCYWGHASGPTHPSNPSGTGDEVSDNVDYSNWLSSLAYDIKLIEPENDISILQGETVTLSWYDSDPDSNAFISLFLDTDSDPNNGQYQILAFLLPEDPDGPNDQFILDTSGIEPGTYYVLGMIYDGENPEKYSYAPGKLTVQSNLLVQNWTTINDGEQTYTAKILRNTSSIDIADKVLDSWIYKDKINSLAITNEVGTSVPDRAFKLSLLGAMACNVLMEKGNWVEKSEYIPASSINYYLNQTDDLGINYPLLSLFEMDNSDLIKISDTSPNNSEGTDTNDQRVKLYKKVISSMVYYLTEENFEQYFKENSGKIQELTNFVNEVGQLTGATNEAVDAMRRGFFDLAGKGVITAEDANGAIITVDKAGTIAKNLGTAFNIAESGTSGYNILKSRVLVYFHMNLITMRKLDSLYDAITNAPSELYDQALVDAIKDIRYDFYVKFFATQTGDWITMAQEIAKDYTSVQLEWGFELAKIWGETALTKLLNTAAIKVYLVIAPWKAGFALWSDRDFMRCSMFSVLIYKILSNALEENNLSAENELQTIIYRNIADQLRGLASYLAYNYVYEYLSAWMVKIGNFLHTFSTQDEAIEYYRQKAFDSLEMRLKRIQPWYRAGEQSGEDISGDQRWLADILTDNIPEEEMIEVPNIPTVPDQAKIDQNLIISTSGGLTNKEHSVEYQFSWGDETVSDWGSNYQNKLYSNAGYFEVKVRSRCKLHATIVSEWSNASEIEIVPQETISKPNQPTGPSTENAQKTITFSTGGSTSSLGNTVEYRFMWGDGTLANWGFATQTHMYQEPGQYSIHIIARSSNYPINRSIWSDGFIVEILPAPAELNASITSPASNLTITERGFINLQGYVDGGKAPFTYLWNFNGGASNSDVEDPGNVAFQTAGVYTVTFTVMDNDGDVSSDTVKVTVYADTDNDGMPDGWEQQIVDADPNDDITSIDDVNPNDDFDSDGCSNLIEYQNDTDPTDSDSSTAKAMPWIPLLLDD